MSVLRQFLIVVVLGAIAAAGYSFQTGMWSPLATKNATKGEANTKKAGKTKGRRGRKKSAAPVLVAKVKTETFYQTVEAVGTTRALQSVEIVPFTSGRIRSLSIAPGKNVSKGDVLAKLRDDIQRADLAEAKAKLTEAKRALARADRLYRKRNIAEARVIEFRAKRAVAEADLARATSRLDDRTIRAPFAGRIGIRRVDVGARVEPSTVLTTLDDISSIEIEARISETLFPKVRVGAEVVAESAAFQGRRFNGKVVAIDKRIDPDTRAFQIRVRIPNIDGTLPAGMFMRLSLQLEQRRNPAIPEEALVVEADNKFAYVVNETSDQVTRTPISIGQRRDALVEVTSGLKQDDTVVVEGTHRLRDGAKIKIKSEAPDGAPAASDASGVSSSTAKARGNRKKDGG